MKAAKGSLERRRTFATASRVCCEVVMLGMLITTLGLVAGCVEIVDIDASLMVEGVACTSDGGSPEIMFMADTHVIELFELTSSAGGPTDCNNCVLTGNGCEPPRRLCRCGPLEPGSMMEVEPYQLEGIRFENLSKDRYYCLRYIALTTESPPLDGSTVDCDCVSLETARSQAVYCGSSDAFSLDEPLEPMPVDEGLMVGLSGGCNDSVEMDACLGNLWY